MIITVRRAVTVLDDDDRDRDEKEEEEDEEGERRWRRARWS